MHGHKFLFVLILVLGAVLSILPVSAQEPPAEPQFPAAAELFVGDEFGGSEGIGFNGEGRLFVTAGRPYPVDSDQKTVPALWPVASSNSTARCAATMRARPARWAWAVNRAAW